MKSPANGFIGVQSAQIAVLGKLPASLLLHVSMKKIGFLSFGQWGDSYGSRVRSAADSLLQSVELAVAAEELVDRQAGELPLRLA